MGSPPPSSQSHTFSLSVLINFLSSLFFSFPGASAMGREVWNRKSFPAHSAAWKRRQIYWSILSFIHPLFIHPVPRHLFSANYVRQVDSLDSHQSLKQQGLYPRGKILRRSVTWQLPRTRALPSEPPSQPESPGQILSPSPLCLQTFLESDPIS